MNVNETMKSSVEHPSLEQEETSAVVACGGIIIRKDMGTVTGRCNECGGHEGQEVAAARETPATTTAAAAWAALRLLVMERLTFITGRRR